MVSEDAGVAVELSTAVVENALESLDKVPVVEVVRFVSDVVVIAEMVVASVCAVSVASASVSNSSVILAAVPVNEAGIVVTTSILGVTTPEAIEVML